MSPTTSASHGTTKLCLLNACSLQNKEELLADIFDDERPDFLAITETWLTPMHGDSTLTKLCPDGYAATHRPRFGKRSGGVAFMYKNSLQCSSFSSSDYSSFKHLDLLLTIRPRPIHIIIVYRPQ
jgi:exonuclease III